MRAQTEPGYVLLLALGSVGILQSHDEIFHTRLSFITTIEHSLLSKNQPPSALSLSTIATSSLKGSFCPLGAIFNFYVVYQMLLKILLKSHILAHSLL